MFVCYSNWWYLRIKSEINGLDIYNKRRYLFSINIVLIIFLFDESNCGTLIVSVLPLGNWQKNRRNDFFNKRFPFICSKLHCSGLKGIIFKFSYLYTHSMIKENFIIKTVNLTKQITRNIYWMAFMHLIESKFLLFHLVCDSTLSCMLP